MPLNTRTSGVAEAMPETIPVSSRTASSTAAFALPKLVIPKATKAAAIIIVRVVFVRTMRNPRSREYMATAGLLGRFDSQQRPYFLICQHVDVAVGPLANVPHPLMQIIQKPLAPDVFELVVQYNPFEVAKTTDFTIARAADEQIVLPGRKFIPRIEHDSRGSDGRHPDNL